MDSINKRIDSLEKTINNLIDSLKKIEDVKNKQDLYSFSTQQLIKWLKDNEVDFNESVKDTLVDIVWTNLNEWEWEYYYENDEISENDENDENDKNNKNNKNDDSESLSDLDTPSDS